MHFLSNECPKFRTGIRVRNFGHSLNHLNHVIHFPFLTIHTKDSWSEEDHPRTSAADNETTVSTTIRPIPD